MSFKEKTSKGFVWTMIDTAFNYVGMFIIGIILARLLSPTEFGVIGIIAIFLTIFDSLIDGGFSNALIRKENITSSDLNTVFIFNLSLSIFLFLSFFLCAPLISVFFEVDITDYARVLGCVIIVDALSVVQRTILTKAMDFQYQAITSATSTIISGSVGICAAYSGLGVWSLIIQQLTRSFVTMLMFWVNSKWYPKMEFSIESFKNLFSFGWKVMASGIIGNIGTQLYTAVIGKVFSKETLGLYSRAQQFTDVLSIKLTLVIRRVTFPAFSSIQQDDVYLLDTYRKMLRLLSWISCSALMILGAVSNSLIILLLGPKWEACAPYLTLMSFMWFFYSSNVLNLNMLQVKGRSDFFLIDQILAVSSTIFPLVIAIKYGIDEMLYSSIFIQFVMYIVGAVFCSKVIPYKVMNQFRDLFPVVIVSLTVFTFVRLVEKIVYAHPIYILLIQLLIGASSFYIMSMFLCKAELDIIKQFIADYRKN